MLVIYALSSLLSFAVAAPTLTPTPTSTTSAPSSTTTSCQAKTFNLPWTLKDITLYRAAGQNENNSHAAISFRFCDTNNGLEMETDCSGVVIGDKSEEDDGGYVLCANPEVGFKMSSNLIMMTRAFLDDCLGPAPYNSGRAFGENNTQMVSTEERSGILWSQASLEVPITSMT